MGGLVICVVYMKPGPQGHITDSMLRGSGGVSVKARRAETRGTPQFK